MTPIAPSPLPEPTSATVAATDIVELLRNTPADARQVYEHSPTHSQNIPFGRMAREAADTITELRSRVAELEQDAARYRFLRDVSWHDGALQGFIDRFGPFEWDDAIDAARGE